MAGRVLEAVILYYLIIKWGGRVQSGMGGKGGKGEESKEKERVRAPMRGC